jgi:hypothetical protein
MSDPRRPNGLAYRTRPDRRLVFGAAWLAMILVLGWGGWQVWRAESSPPAPPSVPPAAGRVSATASVPGMSPSPASPTAAPQLDRSAPVEISIESIGVRARVGEVGLASDGTLEEQPLSQASEAAWYRLGPAPGQVGPAVIVGHVDTKTTLGVFFYLSRVHSGDRVVITRADGRTVTYQVDSLTSVPKSNFPTQLVYGPTSYPALRLITCGGTFDRRAGSYLNNIIVFAHEVD